jgi:type IV secretory pathway VirB10-like protein
LVPPVIEPLVVLPAVPDLEPTPVVIVTATSAEPSPAVSATPPVVASAPSVVASAPPEPVLAAAASQEPPAPPPGPSAVGEPDSAADERVAIALPERMPEPEPEQAAKPDHEGAMDELQRLTLVSHEERVAALRKLPGLGAVAENFAHMLGGLTPDALRAMAQELGLDANGALAPTANGVAGR